MTTRIALSLCITFVVLLAGPPAAHAVDGQILINQAKALSGGVTPGDAAGFPVTISQPGSYRLSGNLVVPNSDTTAVEIMASHVTLDLNGFAILGPTDCAGGANPCAGAGAGHGISASAGPLFNITIRNGTIQGMGDIGIVLAGDSHLVEYVHARSNGTHGIFVGPSSDLGPSIVRHCTAQRNGSVGIFMNEIGTVSHSVANSNGTQGINLNGGGLASYNVVTRNGNFGLFLGSRSSYIGNVLLDNALGAVGAGGVNMGQNLCGANSPCPGAQF